MLGFSILSASIGSSVVKDRVTGAKRLQHMSGLGYRTYWLTNFLYDMVSLGSDIPCVRVCVCMCVLAGWLPQMTPMRRNHFIGKAISAQVAFVCHHHPCKIAL